MGKSKFESTWFLILMTACPLNAAESYAAEATAGDTAKRLPDVGSICTWLNEAKSGKLIDQEGKPLTFTATSCNSKPPRQQRSAACQVTSTQLVAAGESADPDRLCERSNLSPTVSSYCNLREIVKTQQAGDYCAAYTSAEKAQIGLTAFLAIDGAAAAVCWTEYAGLKYLNSTMETGAIQNAANTAGTCSYASVGAGLAELTNIILSNTGGNHATGEYSIDSSNNVQKKSDKSGINITKLLDVVASSGLSLAVIRNGLCQQSRTASTGRASAAQNGVLSLLGADGAKKFCGFLNSKVGVSEQSLSAAMKKTDTANDAAFANRMAAASAKLRIENTFLQTTDKAAKVAQASTDAQLAAQAAGNPEVAAMETALEEARTHLQSRIDVTRSSAQMLTALAAIRGASLYVAGKTKKSATDILQSMFNQTSTGTTFGSSAIGSSAPNIYSSTSTGAFTPAVTAGGTTSAITAGSPESSLLPSGSPLANAAAQIASTMPASKAHEAAAGGAAGIGNMISSMADGMGAKGGGGEINAVTASAFANLPKDDGAGYSGGGGAKLASKGGGDGAGGVDLKGLFGGGEKEEKTAAAADLGYRSPASEDIWHSQNPKGNNLFQIISDRYDTAQRKIGLTQ